MDDKVAQISLLTYRYRGLQYSIDQVKYRMTSAKSNLQKLRESRDKALKELSSCNNSVVLAERKVNDLENISKEVTEMMREIRLLVIQLENEVSQA